MRIYIIRMEHDIAEAILPDAERGQAQWLELNNTFSAQWPNVTRSREAPADDHEGMTAKFGKFFSPEPSEGD